MNETSEPNGEILLLSDLDGVLCDSVPDALRWVWDRYRVVMPHRNIHRYAMEVPISEQLQRAGLTIDAETVAGEMLAACWENASFYRTVRPHTDYWQALLAWVGAGRPLQLATRRRRRLGDVTRGWLAAHGLEITGPGPLPDHPALVMKADKVALAEAGRARFAHVVLVDDALHHCERVAATGAEVWMPARPWNVASSLPDGVERLADVTIAERLLSLATVDGVGLSGA